MIVAARSIENVIVPPSGHANVRVVKSMCLALARNWILSWPRVYGTAAARRNPSCTITTALGSGYCQKPPSGSGKPAGIQSPSPVTTDEKFEYSRIWGDKDLLMPEILNHLRGGRQGVTPCNPVSTPKSAEDRSFRKVLTGAKPRILSGHWVQGSALTPTAEVIVR